MTAPCSQAHLLELLPRRRRFRRTCAQECTRQVERHQQPPRTVAAVDRRGGGMLHQLHRVPTARLDVGSLGLFSLRFALAPSLLSGLFLQCHLLLPLAQRRSRLERLRSRLLSPRSNRRCQPAGRHGRRWHARLRAAEQRPVLRRLELNETVARGEAEPPTGQKTTPHARSVTTKADHGRLAARGHAWVRVAGRVGACVGGGCGPRGGMRGWGVRGAAVGWMSSLGMGEGRAPPLARESDGVAQMKLHPPSLESGSGDGAHAPPPTETCGRARRDARAQSSPPDRTPRRRPSPIRRRRRAQSRDCRRGMRRRAVRRWRWLEAWRRWLAAWWRRRRAGRRARARLRGARGQRRRWRALLRLAAAARGLPSRVRVRGRGRVRLAAAEGGLREACQESATGHGARARGREGARARGAHAPVVIWICSHVMSGSTCASSRMSWVAPPEGGITPLAPTRR